MDWISRFFHDVASGLLTQVMNFKNNAGQCFFLFFLFHRLIFVFFIKKISFMGFFNFFCYVISIS
jgi:hypothetical protein